MARLMRRRDDGVRPTDNRSPHPSRVEMLLCLAEDAAETVMLGAERYIRHEKDNGRHANAEAMGEVLTALSERVVHRFDDGRVLVHVQGDHVQDMSIAAQEADDYALADYVWAQWQRLEAVWQYA